MWLKATRQHRELPQQVGEHFTTDPSLDVGRFLLTAADVEGPDAGNVTAVNVVLAFGSGQFRIEPSTVFVGNPHRLFAGHLTKCEQLFQIALMNARLLLNDPIKGRLGERRFVSLVVPPAAKAVHVDDDIPLELTAEVHRQTHHLGHRLRILSVHVKNWDLQHLCHVGGVDARTRLLRPGGKADLIIHDHMQSAPNPVRVEFAEVERLLNDPFAGKCGITVDQHHHAMLPGPI